MYKDRINSIYRALQSQVGARFVVLATTANINNPAFYIGGLRQGPGFAAANFIFRSTEHLASVVCAFDGQIDAFLIDVELKNELRDLPQQAAHLIQRSPCIHVKPNDMTIDALDMWLTLMRPSLVEAQTLIVGAGNLGGKIALRMAERGAIVELVGRQPEKTSQIVAGLMAIMRGTGRIHASPSGVADWLPAASPDIVLGCTAGMPGVSAVMVESSHDDALLIDVGNGTFSREALACAARRGLNPYCLSPEAGFAAWVAAYTFARQQLCHMVRREIACGIAVIGPGVMGRFGDIIVDDPNDWSRVVGVCNGTGDTLSPEAAAPFLTKLESHTF